MTHLVEAVRYKAEGRGFDTRWGHEDYGSGVDAASNSNECQGYLMGTKAAGAEGWQRCHLLVPIVYKLWEPQPPEALRSSPVTDAHLRFCCNSIYWISTEMFRIIALD